MSATMEIKDATKIDMDMCPICMDDLPMLATAAAGTNRVTTECGHSFHTSCLMSSVAHRGFSCPCCRTEMAEEPEESDDEDDEEYDDEDDEEYEYPPVYVSGIELRRREIGFQGMRLMFQREAGEELEEKDEDEIEDEMDARSEPEEEEEPKPSVEYLVEALTRQGVTMQDMVKVMLMEHEEYEKDDEEYMEASDNIFGKLRVLISNYLPAAQQNQKDLLIIGWDKKQDYIV